MVDHTITRGVRYPMPKTAEYGTYSDDMRAKVTRLDFGFSPKVKTEVSLLHSTPGYEVAGSCALQDRARSKSAF
jgi:hypothetical protein